MDKVSVCVLLRVFDRIEDLQICVDVIKKHWIRNIYHILVVGNGKSSGYPIPEEVKAKVDNVIELDQNPGHRCGNAQLILEGLPHIPETCQYTVLLEADTWVFTDALVRKYISLLHTGDFVWASSEWIEKYWSLGLDFAVVKTSYIKNNPEIFNYSEHAEAWVCNYLLEHDQPFMYIPENMPVHVPKSMRFLGKAYGGRFRSFPKAKMVTHHIEDLQDGIETKKLFANRCLGKREFPLGDPDVIRKEHDKIRLTMALAKLFPRSRWFRKKKKRILNVGRDSDLVQRRQPHVSRGLSPWTRSESRPTFCAADAAGRDRNLVLQFTGYAFLGSGKKYSGHPTAAGW